MIFSSEAVKFRIIQSIVFICLQSLKGQNKGQGLSVFKIKSPILAIEFSPVKKSDYAKPSKITLISNDSVMTILKIPV